MEAVIKNGFFADHCHALSKKGNLDTTVSVFIIIRSELPAFSVIRNTAFNVSHIIWFMLFYCSIIMHGA